MRNLFVTASVVSLLALLACGDDSSTGAGGTGGSGGSPTTGGSPSTGGGGNETGGASSGGGGMGGIGPTGGSGGVGAGTGFTCDDAVGAPPSLTFTEVVTGVDRPVSVRTPPGRPDSLFIVESHDGLIRIFENGALLATPFLDVGDLIRTNNEEGLLGLAFHPDYETNGRFFIHYSAAGNGESTIVEYKRSESDPNVADPVPVQTVLTHPTAQSNHNGGAVEFGNDGFLYISIGDGGSQGDPECDAQNSANLLGKIMRVDVDAAPNGEGYPAAAGNPEGSKIYHRGFRNPWRMAFDPCNADLYIGDVGQGEWEEISLATQAAGALNFGWPMREGANDYNDSCVNPPSNLVDPIAQYDHNGRCSVTGGHVYRGSAIPGLQGTYFYGDYCSGEVFSLKVVNGSVVTQPTVAFTISEVAGFGTDGHGEVYVTELGNNNYQSGAVYRIDAAQ
jgi:glucose/arabinose dehydrogenase